MAYSKGNDSKNLEISPLNGGESIPSLWTDSFTVDIRLNDYCENANVPESNESPDSGPSATNIEEPDAIGRNCEDQSSREVASQWVIEAVSKGDVRSLEAALSAGESPNGAVSKHRYTALHLAAAMGDAQIAGILLSWGAESNVQDLFGRSPVFVAASQGHDACLEVILKAGGDPNAKIVLDSPEEIAQSPSDDYLSRINRSFKVIYPGCNGRTALHEAVRANSPQCVEILLKAGADVEAKDDCGATPLLLAGAGIVATQRDTVVLYERVVHSLVKGGADGNARNDGTATSALLNAVFLGSVPALKYLMKAEADASWSSENGGCTTAVHEAAGSGQLEMLKVLLRHDIDKRRQQKLANLADAVGRTPLHKAGYTGSRECVSLLLDCGGNMSICTITGVSVVEAILKHVPDPMSFLHSIFDSCVTCNNAPTESRDFALYMKFDYLAPESDKRQTAVLNALFTANTISMENKRAFLLHPLVEAFVRFKWHDLRKYFMVVVFINFLFIFTLSAFVTLRYTQFDNLSSGSGSLSVAISVMRYLHIFFAFLVLAIVFGQCATHFQYYMRQFETWTNSLSAALSIFWTLATDPEINPSIDSPFWTNHIINFILPMAWAGMMLLLGRFSMLGSRALLFSVVLKNVIWTFLVLGFMIVGFAFSFFVQFHETNPDAFGDPWKSFFNTMVMMTGEFEYTDTFNNKKIYLPVTSRVLYFTFIVVASIVIVNLIVGLAVTDNQAMNSESEARSLYKRTEFVDLLENMVSYLAHRCALNKHMKIKIHSAPGEKNQIIPKIIPNCLIDSLVQIALSQQAKTQKGTIIQEFCLKFPKIEKGSLEYQILNIMQPVMNNILEAINNNKK